MGGEGGASFLDASADGSDAYFLTEESLVRSDPGSIDVYDARAGGGFPEPETPLACLADACQQLPAPPEDPTPGTLAPNSGNPPQKYYGKATKRKRRCPKGKVRRKVRVKKGKKTAIDVDAPNRHRRHHRKRTTAAPSEEDGDERPRAWARCRQAWATVLRQALKRGRAPPPTRA